MEELTLELLQRITMVSIFVTLPPTIYFLFLTYKWRCHARRRGARFAITLLSLTTVASVVLRIMSVWITEPWFIIAVSIFGVMTSYMIVALAGLGTRVLERRIEEARREMPDLRYEKTSDMSRALIGEMKSLGVK